jgi:hypothetical protein
MIHLKKLSLILLLALGFLLVSCYRVPSSVTPGNPDDGITLKTQFSVYAPDVPFVQFTIENNSGETAEYGSEWTLERLEDNHWYRVPFKPNVGWTQPLMMLGDGGIASDTIHLSVLDHKLKNGFYRIVKEINGIPHVAEFEVGESPVGGNSPYGYAPMESLPANYTEEMARKDGVIIHDASMDMTGFFEDIAAGMNTQLRFAQKAGGGWHVSDLTVEFVLGSMRIRWTDGVGSNAKYASHLVTDGTQIALSPFPTWQREITDYGRMPLYDLEGNPSALAALQQQQETEITSYRRAAFWSEDGTQLLTLPTEEMSPLEFGISIQYEDGGSAGHTVTLDTPGMKAIRSAIWTGENTVLLICDVEDNSLSGMNGYVFYDTKEDKVLSYTCSQYEPVNDHGTIIIPE